jgi:hypothetical protein
MPRKEKPTKPDKPSRPDKPPVVKPVRPPVDKVKLKKARDVERINDAAYRALKDKVAEDPSFVDTPNYKFEVERLRKAFAVRAQIIMDDLEERWANIHGPKDRIKSRGQQ